MFKRGAAGGTGGEDPVAAGQGAGRQQATAHGVLAAARQEPGAQARLPIRHPRPHVRW